MAADPNEMLARERQYHEELYSGFAQQHFAKPAVRALRAHMVKRILAVTGAGPASRVLSLGCGIGDTEILMAPRVGELVGVDLATAAVRQAREDAARAGLRNTRFLEGRLEDQQFEPRSFDVIFAIFFLHHLPDPLLLCAVRKAKELLAPRGRFYSLDPSRYRLSGAVGSWLFPALMRKYQSPGERELDARELQRMLESEDLHCRVGFYDFVSSPLAGLAPAWRAGYLAGRMLDEILIRIPMVRRLGSNLEVVAWKP